VDPNTALRELYASSLYATARHLCGLEEIVPHTHRAPIECLQRPSKRKMIVMPRGTFKTSLASVAYPVWRLIRNPNERVLLDSELYGNSKNLLRQIKGVFESDRFQAVFGDWRTRTWNEGEIVIRPRTNLAQKEASITCSGIGAQKTGQHYDTVIADDLNSPRNSHTPEGCQKVIDHYRMYTSLLEQAGTLVLIGTRYSAGDLIGHVMKNEIAMPEPQPGLLQIAP
jgi:hypothetical protein